MKNLLIIAAYSNELIHLTKNKTMLFSTGIGAIAAAYNLTSLLHKNKPSLIISLNTAGIINTTKLTIGDVVLAKKLTPCSQTKGLYAPTLIKPITAKPKKTLQQHFKTKPLNKLKTVSVYCPQEISSSLSWRNKLNEQGHETETMEAYAYHYVANQFKIPIISILGLTNKIGPNAHKEWKENEDWVCQKMSSLINELI